MAYTPIPAPEGSYEPITDISQGPEVGTLNTMSMSFEKTLLSDTELALPIKLASYLPSSKLKSSILDTTKSIRDQNAYLIQNTPNTLLNVPGDFAANIAGMMLSPINLVTGGAADSLVKSTAEKVLPKFMGEVGVKSFLARTGIKMGLGAAEGTVAIIPQALSSKMVSDAIGEPESLEDVAENIGIGSLLGAGLGSLRSFRSVQKYSDEEATILTALKQAIGGKKINIDDLIINGYFQADKTDGETIDSLMGQRSTLQKHIDDAQQEVTDSTDNFKEATKNHPKASLDIVDGKSLVDDALNVSRIPENLRTPEEQSLIDKLPNTDELKSALLLKSIPKDQLTDMQSKFLTRFDNGEEPEILKDRIGMHQEEINDINKTLEDKKDTLDEDQSNKLKADRDELKSKISEAKNRLRDLNKRAKEPKKIKAARARLINAHENLNNLNGLGNSIDNWLALKLTAPEALSKEGLESSFNYQNSWKSDEEVYEEQAKYDENEAIETEKKMTAAQNLDALSKRLEDRLQAVSEEEADKARIANAKYIDESKKANTALDNLKKCFIGGSK